MNAVKQVSTFPPTECGIAKYTEALVGALNEDGHYVVTLEPMYLKNNDPFSYVKSAVEVANSGADIVHVQYECGLFGKAGVFTTLFYLLLRGMYHGKIVTTMHEVVNPSSKLFIHYKFLYMVIDRCSDRMIFHTNNSREDFYKYV